MHGIAFVVHGWQMGADTVSVKEQEERDQEEWVRWVLKALVYLAAAHYANESQRFD